MVELMYSAVYVRLLFRLPGSSTDRFAEQIVTTAMSGDRRGVHGGRVTEGRNDGIGTHTVGTTGWLTAKARRCAYRASHEHDEPQARDRCPGAHAHDG